MADRLSFFDLMSVINSKTKIEWGEDEEKAFNTFMINRGFSNFADSVLVASELNQYPLLDKKLCFDFYYHILPKAKRFGKWEKALAQSKDEELVMDCLGVSRDKTATYIRTLDAVDPEWRKKAEEMLEQGGRRKK